MEQAIDLCNLIERYGSEDKCREYLEQLRWLTRMCCIRCGEAEKVYPIFGRGQYVCDSCGYQFSVMAGTIFHDTHLPLWKWFLATYLLCESRKGMSANQIKRTLGVSYKTAWYLCHRIRAAMAEADGHKLKGIVEVDETYIGGKQHGHKRQLKNKAAVIGIRERGAHLHFIHANNVNQQAVYDIIARNVDKTVDVIMTDDSKLYNFDMTQYQGKHESVNHSAAIESAFSLFKRGIVGTWHKVSTKHLAAYLQEMTWRFNNRKNPFLFRDTIQKLLNSPNVEYKELTAA